MTDKPQGPLILEVDQTKLPDAPSPAEAPPPADPGAPAGERAIALAAGRGGWGLSRMLFTVIGALVVLWLGVSLNEFIAGLFTAYGWLGWVGTALVGLLVGLLVIVGVRELAGLARLARVETLRTRAVTAHETGSTAVATAVMDGLERLYRGRADLEWAGESLRAAQHDTPDATGRLAVAERVLLQPLDGRAEDAVRRASRDVAAATALIPLPLVDVLAALTVNLRMVRQIAEIYGGRAGWLGSWRLMRAVAAHLIATGAIAAVDDMLGPLVGGGVLAKLSRRFGEGALNGALTARVGVAAIEVCRPLPFVECQKPNASGIVLRALRAWRSDNAEQAS